MKTNAPYYMPGVSPWISRFHSGFRVQLVCSNGASGVSMMLNPVTFRHPAEFLLPFQEAVSHGYLMIRSSPNGVRQRRRSLKISRSRPGVADYQYRHYDPQTGRWSSRDPIEEAGGINLYAFVKDDSINEFDVIGLMTYDEAMTAGSDDARAKTQASIDPKIGEISGKEYCGLICRCGSSDEFKPTPAHSGPKPTLKQFLMGKKFEWRRTAPANCDPTFDYESESNVSCGKFGDKWKMVAAYHSHPTNSGWSPSDDVWLNEGYGFGKVTPDGKIEVLTEGGKLRIIRPAGN